jgi:hypothetical protein
MLNEAEESATLIDIQRRTKLKDHPALKELQPVLRGDASDGGRERRLEGARVRRLAVVDREGGPFVFNAHSRDLSGSDLFQGRFQGRAVSLGLRRDLYLGVGPPFQTVVAHVDQLWHVDAISHVDHGTARDDGYQRQTRMEQAQKLAVAWRDLGSAWIGDDGADRPVHIGDQAQAGLADEALQGAGNGALPAVRFLHGFSR